MGSLLLLITLSAVMALASFFAGVLPLSVSLSQPQVRLISSIGMGILVGTALVVIIPEGIEAVATPPAPALGGTTGAGAGAHVHRPHGIRALLLAPPASAAHPPPYGDIGYRWGGEETAAATAITVAEGTTDPATDPAGPVRRLAEKHPADGEVTEGDTGPPPPLQPASPADTIPTLDVGLSLVLGFILMFLVDRIPRHATESMRSAAQPRQFSLDTLGGDSTSIEDGDDDDAADGGFLESLAPSPRRARSLATTVGLIIHATADGIAMGASFASGADPKLGTVVFLAIMFHKAPAAFGLTSVLLSQGLSKRAARGHLIVFSLAAPAGALATRLLIGLVGGMSGQADNKAGAGGGAGAGDAGRRWTGTLLLFSAGTFLYVAMHAMQEDSASQGGHGHGHGHGHHHHHHRSGSINGFVDGGSPGQQKRPGPQMKDTLATVGGMLLPLLTQIGHGH